MVYPLKISENLSVSRLKSIIAQCIAIMSPSMLLLDIGMAVSFPTIAVPYLLHSTTDLSMTDSQASWFGSLSYLTQPFGAIMSGPVVDYFGRKRASFIVNIPHLVAWIIMYYAPNLPTIFFANGLLGIGTGLMEAPIFAYVGEVSEPSIRGALTTATQCFLGIGVLSMYFLGTVVYWRQAALISLAAPITAMLLISLVPETPVWFLSQGRKNDALKSLCYLRGWTKPENVQEEFDKLVIYAKNLTKCVLCCQNEKDEGVHDKGDCEHQKLNVFKRFYQKFNVVMICKETLRPLSLIVMYFLFFVMSGLTPIRPNMVHICDAFGMASGGKNAVFMVGVITFLSAIIVIFLIKLTGKRKLGITAMLGTGVSCAALSAYAKLYLPDTVFSFEPSTFPKETSYVPLVFFYALALFTSANVSWVMLAEVFPFRSRASAQGFGAAWNYLVTFIGAKTYVNLETSFQLWGTFAVYAFFGFLGTIYLYFFMPETEGVPLEDIENFYNGKFRTFANDPFIRLFKRSKRKEKTDRDIEHKEYEQN